MQDDTPGAFRALVQWLCSQKLPHIHDQQDFSHYHTKSYQESHHAFCGRQIVSHIQLWVLAEKLLIPQLQDEVLYLLNTVGQTCHLPFIYSLHGIYANTSEDSPLRRFVVNLLAWSLESDKYKRKSDLSPNAFLIDLATVFSAAVPERTARNRRAKTDVKDYYSKNVLEIRQLSCVWNGLQYLSRVIPYWTLSSQLINRRQTSLRRQLLF